MKTVVAWALALGLSKCASASSETAPLHHGMTAGGRFLAAVALAALVGLIVYGFSVGEDRRAAYAVKMQESIR